MFVWVCAFVCSIRYLINPCGEIWVKHTHTHTLNGWWWPHELYVCCVRAVCVLQECANSFRICDRCVYRHSASLMTSTDAKHHILPNCSAFMGIMWSAETHQLYTGSDCSIKSTNTAELLKAICFWIQFCDVSSRNKLRSELFCWMLDFGRKATFWSLNFSWNHCEANPTFPAKFPFVVWEAGFHQQADFPIKGI